MLIIIKDIFRALNGFAMGIIPAIIGAAGLIGSAAISASASKSNNNNSMFMAKNAHQIEKQDLIKAGMNPILTANGAGAPVPNFNTPDFSSLSQLGTVASNAVERKQQKTMLQIQRDLADAEIELKAKEAKEHEANANAINGYKADESEATRQAIENETKEKMETFKKRKEKLVKEIEHIEATTENTEKNKDLTEKKIELYDVTKKIAIAGDVLALTTGGMFTLFKLGKGVVKLQKIIREMKDVNKKVKVLESLGWKRIKKTGEFVHTKTGEVKTFF